MSAPDPVLARYDDAELIAELERRTNNALRNASKLKNPALDVWCAKSPVTRRVVG